jgi:hypothetical protein
MKHRADIPHLCHALEQWEGCLDEHSIIHITTELAAGNAVVWLPEVSQGGVIHQHSAVQISAQTREVLSDVNCNLSGFK